PPACPGAGRSRPSDALSLQPMLGHGAGEALAADVQVEVAAGRRKGELGAAVDQGGEILEQAAVEGADLDLRGAVDAPALGLAADLEGVAVGVDGDPCGGLAGAVEPLG